MWSSSTVPIVSTIAARVAVAIVAAIVHIVVVSIVTATIIIIIATITAVIMLGDTLLAANPSRFWFTLVVAMVVSCVHNDIHQCG